MWKNRTERLIAAARLVLAVSSLMAVWLDPSEPGRLPHLANGLLAGYTVYAAILAFLVWRAPTPRGRLPIIAHVFDLAVFSFFQYVTARPMSTFSFFLFSVICGTLRWQLRGTLWTAGAALTIYTGLGIVEMEFRHSPIFEPYRHMVRTISLTVASIMLGYLGILQDRHRRELSMLAAWPHDVPSELAVFLRGELDHLCGIVRAPRVLMAWNEEEEPWLHLASWSSGKLIWTREPPNRFEPLVAGPLSENDFLCQDLRVPGPSVLHASSAGFERWEGSPLHPDLQQRFAIKTVLSLKLRGKSLEGRLFYMDKQGLASDDLLLGQIAARAVSARMDLFYLIRRLEHLAAAEACLRISYDLHDGLLQSLAAVTMKLDAVCRTLETEPSKAKGLLSEIDRLLLDEQAGVRSFIRDLKSTFGALALEEADLSARLEGLVKHVEAQWGLRVDLNMAGLDSQVVEVLGRDIYYLVRESLLNAARHSGASSAGVSLHVENHQMRITVSDNGRGFSFSGHYDHATLMERKLGPVTLKGRIASLGGTLAIDSNEAGARLEITVPLPRPGG